MTCDVGRWLATHAGVEIAAISLLVGTVSLFYAIQTYQANARTKRAEFLMQLHKAFFVDTTYAGMRTLLDETEEAVRERLAKAVKEQTAEFTDFLNFFELIAYFQECGTLTKADVEALLGYYLHLLKTDDCVAAYIAKPEISFEHLQKLLAKID